LPANVAVAKLQKFPVSSVSINFPWTCVDPNQTLSYLALSSVTSFFTHKLLDNFDSGDPK